MKVSAALLIVGVIALAGNIFLLNKIGKLWPVIVSIFFASVKIYTVFSLFLNQLFS
jgi:hypothetical protein